MAFRTALLRVIQNANRKTDRCSLSSSQWRLAGQMSLKPPALHSFSFSYASDASAQKFLDGKVDDLDASASLQISRSVSFEELEPEVCGANCTVVTELEALSVIASAEQKFIPPVLAEAGSNEHKPELAEDGTPSVTDTAIVQIGEEGNNPNNVLENADPSTSGLSASAKPRVMSLPEDIIPEALPLEDGKAPQKQKKEKQKKLFLFEHSGLEIPLPVLAPQESKKRKDAVALADAIREIKTVEAHVRLGIDPRRGDQMVRGAATLPHGTGKIVKVAVFAEGAAAEEAKAAGADVVGADNLVAEIFQSGGKLNFDKCIATPALMPKLGKVARILGPRGLMPNPKVGTVTNNVGEAVKAAKCGRVDFKADKTGIVHAGLGKVSFTEEALKDNIAAFAGALLAAKPVGLKKSSRYAGYFNSFTLSSTMGPGIPVTIQSLALAADNFIKVMEMR
ncbi:hypothetical protein O6H91_02G031200 [Diphasiastrum complanatum]|uniref:Uncharacterized protein n=1 Tax=Diphasiastrum complanatum TaxID=34168 RepID=A0ACC2EE47_DIPCM|nr:hypothetical protein O6H91_02G031200 [Diphasiastrum complanatum]